VVNHHVLASDLLQRFFVSIDQVRPDVRRIILISPDHYKRGTSPISVGTTDYVTQSRVVRVDRTAIEHLHLLGVAFGDRELFEHEHGIGALIPFLAKAFPQAAIVPLVVRADIADEDAQRFGERLAESLMAMR
jgi:poly-gamma-glutamate synthesis protein (capsule biosynthesis protein)